MTSDERDGSDGGSLPRIVEGALLAPVAIATALIGAGRTGCAVLTGGIRRIRHEVDRQIEADRELARRRRGGSSTVPGLRTRPTGSRDAALAEEDQCESSDTIEVDDEHPDYGLPISDDLALPDYDHLPASQIVAMLGDLDEDERRSIERYESVNRHRRTVLGKLDQLRART